MKRFVFLVVLVVADTGVVEGVSTYLVGLWGAAGVREGSISETPSYYYGLGVSGGLPGVKVGRSYSQEAWSR